MTYKLAEKLQKAGFPQKKGFLCEPRKNKEAVYFPILEELIEELGGMFNSLNQQVMGFKGDKDLWIAKGNLEDIETGGKTPLEVVAKLYIKINSK